MNYMKYLFYCMLIGVCVYNMPSYAANTKKTLSTQISIDLDFIPPHIKPGDKPLTLNKSLLAKLLPEWKNPRLMSLQDLDHDEQEVFLEGGYAFVLRGDFNRDKLADIVFVGKYDAPGNSTKNCFVTIVTIKGKKVIRSFLSKIQRDRISLLRVINYKPQIDAIGMSYNLVSDDCGYLYWTGKKWQFDQCPAAF